MRVLDETAALTLLIFDGALLGAFGLAFTSLHVNGVPVPMGALLSVLILPWLVLRAGEIDHRPGTAGAPLTAWFAVVAILGITGPGGDGWLPLTDTTWWKSLLLVGGGLAAGLLALRRVMENGYRKEVRNG